MAGKRPDVVWLPTPERVVDAMLRLADAGPEDVLYDLGSGDGRTTIAAAARFGVREARGVEIRAHLLRRSREEARRAGMNGRVRFVDEDLFRTNLARATVVTLYLLPRLNLKLRPRLLGELRPGARVVSHNFGMGDWDPDRTLETRDLFGAGEAPRADYRVFLWTVPADAGGTWRLTGPDGEEFGLEIVRRFQKVHGALLFDGGRVPLRKAKLKGDALSFAVRGVPGLKPKARFEGRVDGEKMSGSFDAGWGSSKTQRNWTAERFARQER
ncbi:MAG: SAM-dependent methyltransferase [Actinomycetota bacterium]|nr:SAM-dependent methyltransferase [Actinomycetota bacterium]